MELVVRGLVSSFCFSLASNRIYLLPANLASVLLTAVLSLVPPKKVSFNGL